MGGNGFEAEQVYLPERLIVAPHAGVFQVPPGVDTIADEGSVIREHQVLGTIELTHDSFTVTSPHTGILMGLLVTPGERVRKSQPLAWLRLPGGPLLAEQSGSTGGRSVSERARVCTSKRRDRAADDARRRPPGH